MRSDVNEFLPVYVNETTLPKLSVTGVPKLLRLPCRSRENMHFQAEGISIGSGTIESTVKQIAARIKLSGTQWKAENVPQVLLHRCAYLNGKFSN